MNHIILKDLHQQRYLLLGFAVALVIVGILPINISALPHVLILLSSVILTIILNEAVEEKDKGYFLLASLPVSRLGVILAKFAVMLIECFLFSLISFVILTIKGKHPSIFIDVPTAISVSFFLSMAVGAIMQSGVYILGLKNFTRGMLVLVLGGQVYIFILSVESFTGGTGLVALDNIWQRLLDIPGLFHYLLAFVIWSGVLLFTSQFRKRI